MGGPFLEVIIAHAENPEFLVEQLTNFEETGGRIGLRQMIRSDVALIALSTIYGMPQIEAFPGRDPKDAPADPPMYLDDELKAELRQSQEAWREFIAAGAKPATDGSECFRKKED